MRKTQPIYGFWFYHMWENVVGPLLGPAYHSILNPKTSGDVDKLMSAEVTMYALFAFLALYTFFAYVALFAYLA